MLLLMKTHHLWTVVKLNFSHEVSKLTDFLQPPNTVAAVVCAELVLSKPACENGIGEIE